MAEDENGTSELEGSAASDESDRGMESKRQDPVRSRS